MGSSWDSDSDDSDLYPPVSDDDDPWADLYSSVGASSTKRLAVKVDLQPSGDANRPREGKVSFTVFVYRGPPGRPSGTLMRTWDSWLQVQPQHRPYMIPIMRQLLKVRG